MKKPNLSTQIISWNLSREASQLLQLLKSWSANLFVIVCFRRYLTGSNQPVISTKPDPFYRVFNAFPVILLGYACHFNAVPVYANMEDRSLANWTKVSVIATCCCFVCYSLVGIGGWYFLLFSLIREFSSNTG